MKADLTQTSECRDESSGFTVSEGLMGLQLIITAVLQTLIDGFLWCFALNLLFRQDELKTAHCIHLLRERMKDTVIWKDGSGISSRRGLSEYYGLNFRETDQSWTINWNIKISSAISKSQDLQFFDKVKCVIIYQCNRRPVVLQRCYGLQIIFSRCKETCSFGKEQKKKKASSVFAYRSAPILIFLTTLRHYWS